MPEQRYRLFVSSAQKELEIERVAVAGAISSDLLLSQWYEPCSRNPLLAQYLNQVSLMGQRYRLVADSAEHPVELRETGEYKTS